MCTPACLLHSLTNPPTHPPRRDTHVHTRTIATQQDPKAVKPEDWDERAQIPDPKDKKPAGWDDIPATIVDPDAKKPGACAVCCWWCVHVCVCVCARACVAVCVAVCVCVSHSWRMASSARPEARHVHATATP
jgi:hypothetical protein